MNADALILMIVVMAIIWGGLVASIVFLARRPEAGHLPDGGEDTVVPDYAPLE